MLRVEAANDLTVFDVKCFSEAFFSDRNKLAHCLHNLSFAGRVTRESAPDLGRSAGLPPTRPGPNHLGRVDNTPWLANSTW